MKTNLLIATLIVILLTAWMVIGSLFAESEAEKKAAAEPQKEEKPLPSVRVRDSVAEPFARQITLRGKTEASRASVLKAEVGAQVLEIVAERGSSVKKGDPLIRFDSQYLPDQLTAAKALVEQRTLEFQAAKKLQSSGYQSETRLAEASSLLADAKNNLAATEFALKNTIVAAPYDGIFNERLVEVGEFVAVGDPIANFLALDPLIITAEATEQEIRMIDYDSPVSAHVNGKEISGQIRYLSNSAHPSVRTYTVEMEFPNPKLKFKAGLTADIVATTATQLAHKVTPAILFLSADTNGDLGLKTVGPDDKVSFFKTEIIGSAEDGVWVSGLPEEVKLITVGQGYVVPGATVNAVDESSIN